MPPYTRYQRLFIAAPDISDICVVRSVNYSSLPPPVHVESIIKVPRYDTGTEYV